MPVTLSVPRPSPAFTPMFVAIDRGFFAEEGLQPAIKYHARIQGLLAGEVDFLGNDMGHVEFLRGADIRRVCGHSSRGGEHVLVIRPGVGSVEKLKNVLVSGEQNVVELKNILAHYGVHLDSSEIKTTQIEGSHPKQWEVLKQGIGDGAMLGTPWWIYAVKEGYKNAGDGAECGPGLPTSGISVTADKIARSLEQVRAFVRAYVKSMRYCKERVPETLETMVKYCDQWGADNPEIAKIAYDLKAPYWSAVVDVKAVDRLLQLTCEKMGKAPVPAENFLDLRFLQAALRDFG